MEGVGKFVFGILSVLVIMNFADGAINSWKYDTGAAGTALTFSKSIAENATGTIVTALATTNTTGATGAAGVTHTIGSQTNAGQFEIATGAANTGVVTLASGKTLDAESDTALTIQVIATDDGTVQESATATITLTITDVNEHTPVFKTPSTASASISVNETSTVGSTVYTVSATDADVSNGITYAIATGNTNGAFAINPSSGAITVAIKIITNTTYALSVSATDSGTPTKSDSVTLNVATTCASDCTSGNNGNANAKASMFAVLMAAIFAFCKIM